MHDVSIRSSALMPYLAEDEASKEVVHKHSHCNLQASITGILRCVECTLWQSLI